MKNRTITITLDENDREVVKVRLHPNKTPDILIFRDYLKEGTSEECAEVLKEVNLWIDLLVDHGIRWVNLSYR